MDASFLVPSATLPKPNTTANANANANPNPNANANANGTTTTSEPVLSSPDSFPSDRNLVDTHPLFRSFASRLRSNCTAVKQLVAQCQAKQSASPAALLRRQTGPSDDQGTLVVCSGTLVVVLLD